MSSKAKTQAKPVVETPVVETPVVETPVVETPVVETPDELTDEQKLAKLKADADDALAALEGEIGDAESEAEADVDTQGNYPYAPVEEAKGEQEPEFLKQYREAYPLEAEFLVTSDGNVFLAQGRGDALNHARSLGTELKTYKA